MNGTESKRFINDFADVKEPYLLFQKQRHRRLIGGIHDTRRVSLHRNSFLRRRKAGECILVSHAESQLTDIKKRKLLRRGRSLAG